MTEFLQSLEQNLTDILIYAAIALVALVGLIKCIHPVRKSTRCLRRGIHALETMVPADGVRPLWQDALFLGRPLQTAWRRFLYNAEQLDARGLCCDVEEYVNDDTVIYDVGHPQLAEVIPSLLTSLGILGTFIGLMRGLGSLDVSDAAKTMESIPTMIGGMAFAFSTSIAGIACSLCFNVLNRMSVGGAEKAIDEFYDAFTELVMQKPLEEGTQNIIQQEDRSAFLRLAVTDLGAKLTDGINVSMNEAFEPVSRSMNRFILSESQAQVEGISRMANKFVEQMNQSMGGQFMQLGKTLSAFNQQQNVNMESMQNTMKAADAIMQHMTQMNQVTGAVMERFEGYVQVLSQQQTDNGDFARNSNALLAQMHQMSQEQSKLLKQLQGAQAGMEAGMQEYANWSGRVLQSVHDMGKDTGAGLQKASDEMKDAGKALRESYGAFVENISTGLARTMGMFDENMTDVLKSMGAQINEMKKALDENKNAAGFVQQASEIQKTLDEINRALQKGTEKEGA